MVVFLEIITLVWFFYYFVMFQWYYSREQRVKISDAYDNYKNNE